MVERLVDEEKTAGTYEVVFESRKILNATYYYWMKAEKFLEKKAMRIIKEN